MESVSHRKRGDKRETNIWRANRYGCDGVILRNFLESVLEVAIRSFFDKHYPAKTDAVDTGQDNINWKSLEQSQINSLSKKSSEGWAFSRV